MERSTKGPRGPHVLSSPLAVAAIIIAAILLAVSAGRIAVRAVSIVRERSELASRLALLKAENERLARELSALASGEAVERLAKERLNLKNPGEEVVVVTPPSAAPTPGAARGGLFRFLPWLAAVWDIFRR